ncbi:hypothetical protein M9Y10_001447 [Tritrichomonas musculus]|uniref:Uncharacterized protein n=1 Tax=Tritrichomonas musculus TaxID=1915356 RepID=A0ABR2L713_9EUKA
MSIKLDPCLEEIIKGSKVDDPIVQVIEISASEPKQKITISDGVHYIVALLNDYTTLFISNKLQNFQLIKIKYQLIKQYIVIQNIDIIPIKIDGIIGKITQLQINTSKVSKTAKGNYVTIDQLMPYLVDYVLIARVVAKSTVRGWKTKTGYINKYFRVVLKDTTGEICGIFFSDEADFFFKKIELNKVYEIRNGKIDDSKHEQDDVKNNYEIYFKSNSLFDEVEDDKSIPFNDITFTPIKDIDFPMRARKSFVDILGIIVDVGEITYFHTNKEHFYNESKNLKNRRIIIADKSEATINFVLWNDEVSKIDSNSNDHVIQIMQGQVSEYQGRREITVGKITNFDIVKILDKKQMDLLQWWMRNKSRVGDFEHLSSPNFELIKIQDIGLKNLGTQPKKPDFFSCVVKIERLYQSGYYFFFNDVQASQNSPSQSSQQKSLSSGAIFYMNGCPSCYAKLKEIDGWFFECPRCTKKTDKPKILYNFDVKLGDETGDTVFRTNIKNQKIGETILGVTAEQWKLKTEQLDFTERIKVMTECVTDRNFRIECKAHQEGGYDLVILVIENIFEVNLEEAHEEIEDPQID